MKVAKRLLAAVCVICVILAIVSQGKVYSANKRKKYVALGDSQAAGYGLQGYVGGLKAEPPEDSYQVILAGLLDADRVNGSITGITSQELIDLLNSGKLDKDLKNADYVTISIGSNDILGIFLDLVAEKVEVKKGQKLEEAVKEMFQTSGILSIAKKVYELNAEVQDNDEMHEAATQFANQWSEIISIVKKKAPKAEIYAANIYNPYVNADLMMLPLGTYSETYIKELNEAFQMDSKDYTMIDVHSLFADGSQVNVNVDYEHLENTDFDPHPNKLGHRLIAETFYNAIQKQCAEHLKKSTIRTLKYKDSQIKIRYKEVQEADGYIISYSAKKDGDYKKLKTTAKTSTSISTEKLKKGKTYYIKVTPYVLCGEEQFTGSQSSVKKITIK